MKFVFSLVTAAALTAIVAPTASAQAPWPVIYKDANVNVALDTANAKRNAFSMGAPYGISASVQYLSRVAIRSQKLLKVTGLSR